MTNAIFRVEDPPTQRKRGPNLPRRIAPAVDRIVNNEDLWNQWVAVLEYDNGPAASAARASLLDVLQGGSWYGWQVTTSKVEDGVYRVYIRFEAHGDTVSDAGNI